MCSNGLIAQITPLEAQRYENRLNVEAYSRSNALAQDIHSRNYIDIGHRWFNLPDYKTMYRYIIDFYSKYQSIGDVQYFDKSKDNTVYALRERPNGKTICMPTRTAIAYNNNMPRHKVLPYKKFKGDISKVYEEQSVKVFQNRPDVLVKKQLIGVEVL